MRTVRLVLALLIAAGLAMLPVSAAMAISHVSSADMHMSAPQDGGSCCDHADGHGCPLALCCHIQLAMAEQPQFAGRLASLLAPIPLTVEPGAALGPDPPPPRS